MVAWRLSHCLQALAFANDGNLWVSGAAGMSLLNIDPGIIGIMDAEYVRDSIGASTLLTPGAAPINLITAQVIQLAAQSSSRCYGPTVHASCKVAHSIFFSACHTCHI